MGTNLLIERNTRPYYGKMVLDEFKLPIMRNIFFINKDGILNNSEEIEFTKNSWKYNPRQFCLDYYKLQEFYPLVLLINNIKSQFDFIPDNVSNRLVVVPRYKFITNLIDNR